MKNHFNLYRFRPGWRCKIPNRVGIPFRKKKHIFIVLIKSKWRDKPITPEVTREDNVGVDYLADLMLDTRSELPHAKLA